MSSNKQNLAYAKKNKKDEFYTQLSDIEKELRHYRDHFKDKIVYCNCDDPKVSNFFKYFTQNFEFLGLKKVIATCYKNRLPIQFSEHQDEKACYMIYEGDKNKNRQVDDEEIDVQYLEGDGDFRSKESIEFLKEADIVCTNPPFSLFREYVAQLIEYKKKFLIIGSDNAISYKEIFPFIKNNHIWLGVNKVKEFEVRKDNSKGKYCHDIKKYFQKFGNVGWYTNLRHFKRKEKIILFKEHDENEYPRYENYDAIEVSKVNNIPKNWGGVYGCTNHFSYQIQSQAI